MISTFRNIFWITKQLNFFSKINKCFWIIHVTRKKRRRKWLQLDLNLLHNGMHYSTHPVVLLSVVVGHALIGTAITEVAVVGVTYIL